MKDNDNINLLFIILIFSGIVFICKAAQPEVAVQNTSGKTVFSIKNKYKHRLEVFICAKNSCEDWSRRVLVSNDAEITIYKKAPSSFVVDDPGPCIIPLVPEIDNIDTIQADIVDYEYKTIIKKILIQK